MTNYICINGKKAELTEEQMKALGIELPKKPSPFDRVREAQSFYYIGSDGNVAATRECYSGFDTSCYKYGNYCTDRSIMEQRALHETLNRLLWRFVMENECEGRNHNYWGIHRDFSNVYQSLCSVPLGIVAFNSEKMAKRALKEIVEPFIETHPDFKF